MQTIKIDQTELYNLIKRAVRDVLEEEILRQRINSLPFVSDEEMRDIEAAYGKPPSHKDSKRAESLDV